MAIRLVLSDRVTYSAKVWQAKLSQIDDVYSLKVGRENFDESLALCQIHRSIPVKLLHCMVVSY